MDFEFIFLFLFRWFRYWRLYWRYHCYWRYHKVFDKLLTNYFKPDNNYKFPSKFQHGCMRALAYHWLASFPFLVYSKRHYSVFCLPCTLFDKSEISQKSKFSKNTGFSSWFKISEKVSKLLSCEETCEKNISNYSKHSLNDDKSWIFNTKIPKSNRDNSI